MVCVGLIWLVNPLIGFNSEMTVLDVD
jgi:hypothetical protein